ncbi:hypothetical protein N7490_004783 [Penicillium lividum]|nr:hypothetical protein N7490_004783 [Penicillium lividum]
MKVDAQPHMSRQSKAKYDELWNALGTTFTSLTHIRIYIDTPRLAELLKMPRGSSENDKTSYIQHAWLDGIQAMVDANDNLQVFEVHFYTKVYGILRAKVKPWLGEMEKQRRVKNSGVKYKAYKTRSQDIKWGSGCGTDISDGSSHIDIHHPMTQESSFWARKRKKLMEQARKDTVHTS